MQEALILCLASGLVFSEARAQTQSDSANHILKVYELGEVVVSGNSVNSTVSRAEMRKFNTPDVARSVNILPSVTLVNGGGRNETTIFLRGFDLRSVPVFADGIPVYVPYDGYVDLGRFTNADLSKIEVSKGYSSILFGANTIGGSINMISSKPTEKLEINLRAGLLSGRGYSTVASIGSLLGKFYFMGNFSKYSRDYYNLSHDFERTQNETDRKRDNSYRNDDKISLKAGYTPNATDEYSINYIYQHGAKGNPVYLGADENVRIRYWQWPRWDKQSIYFVSKTNIAEKNYLKTRIFYDKFVNTLKSYDDNNYSDQTRPYAFTSFYDDYSYGANFEAGTELVKNNVIKIAGHYKYDMHRENNENEPVRQFADKTVSFGIEDVFSPSDKLRLIPGFSFNTRNSVIAENYDSENEVISDYPENKNSATNAQIAAYYRFSDNFNLSLTTAHKTRFATMKDRYSYRMGMAMPNPDLEAETAINYELASKIRISDKISLEPGVFYSKINNTIQMVDNVQPDISQMQNTGESEFYGAELSFNIQLLKDVAFNANYTYIERNNISDPEILFTGVPKHKVFAYFDYLLLRNLEFIVSAEYNSDRYSTSDGMISPGFVVFNSRISWAFTKYITTEAGINNIFDKSYTLVEGYPEQGRNFYFTLIYNLKKMK